MLWFALIVAINIETESNLMVIQGGLQSWQDCQAFSQMLIEKELKHTFAEVSYGCYTEKELLGRQPINMPSRFQ